MYNAIIENSKGEQLKLNGNESRFQVLSIVGLNPPQATINTTNIAGLDGSKFNSSKLENRNIVITIRLNGNVEENRLTLYSMFRTKENCKFYYETDSRNVWIGGYIETVECDLFSQSETMQISIICTDPYFRSVGEKREIISYLHPLFEFPFAINQNDPIPVSELATNRQAIIDNDSDAETGVVIEINVLGTINIIQINALNTGEFIGVSDTFYENDKIIIDTTKGQKSVSLVRNGTKTSIFGKLLTNSRFFQLQSGVNTFSYSIDNGSNDDEAEIVFVYANTYRGV